MENKPFELKEGMILFYRLTGDEISKLEARERYFERNPDGHPSHLYQSINLDMRNPSYSEELIDGDFTLNPESIIDYIKHNVFCIDVIADGSKTSRFLIVHKKNLAATDTNNSTYKINENISLFFDHRHVNVYTLDDVLEKETSPIQ